MSPQTRLKLLAAVVQIDGGSKALFKQMSLRTPPNFWDAEDGDLAYSRVHDAARRTGYNNILAALVLGSDFDNDLDDDK